MNKTRRRKIKGIIEKLRECSEGLSEVKEEEDEARDNIPESLQETDTYYSSEACSDNIEEAIYEINNVADTLEEI